MEIPMLTRKDYISLCDAMAEGLVNKNFTESVCSWLSKDNPRFDRAKFEMFLRTLIEKKQKAKEVSV
jgi:hypothetical protein